MKYNLTFFGPGIAREGGWQNIGAYVNLGSYYVVGIPLANLLGFVHKLGGKGLWIGKLTRNITITSNTPLTHNHIHKLEEAGYYLCSTLSLSGQNIHIFLPFFLFI